jgi:SAM-dependent methyltransferase
MTEKRLRKHRKVWQQKPALQAIYTDFYRQIITSCRPGRSLEIGGGSGILKKYLSKVISTDIIPLPWLDAASDAQALPFQKDSLSNIVGVDVLHHIERPQRFFIEAERVLKPGGRIVLLEPAITPLSYFFYILFHPEGVALQVDPLAEGPLDSKREPFDGNQAIPTLLFQRYRDRLQEAFPRLKLIQVDHLSLFAYPLSGGFRPWCLIPTARIKWLLRVEKKLMPLLGHLSAFRILCVIEKREHFP